MAKDSHISILLEGVEAWNRWRSENPDIRPDLSGADLSRLTNTELKSANLARVDLTEANLDYAYLSKTILRGAQLNRIQCHNTTLIEADLCEAQLQDARLSRANLYRANCTKANFSGSHLNGASFVGTNVEGACFDDCEVYGLSAWGLQGAPRSQLNLIVTPPDEPVVTVDRLEVAQFIYTLLENPKIRDVIHTVTSKAVLILGRFTDERKSVLDSLKSALRNYGGNGYIPILFDFPSSPRRDLTETVQLLANMARFVIVDLTDAKSIPQELSHIIPFLPSVPIQPIILSSERKYAMYEHWEKFSSVLPAFPYEDEQQLIEKLEAKILEPVQAWEREQDKVRALEEKVKELEAELEKIKKG